MYEFHGWFGIAESTEEADAGALSEGVQDLRERIAGIQWATAEVRLTDHNGQFFLNLDGLVNRRRDEAEEVAALLDHVAKRFPGSWGLLYERSDDLVEPPGPGAFRVSVMARGTVTERLDPFLSPCSPVIED
ncbi:Imm7 family immunity protein [Kitasatospora sp. NPDC056138]|uniref:Imm7 family immunity protein n=1 Tax=Kitasatospora sp. NPDC056138 TaxID=3345724 RepID=UPI0035D6EDC3